MKRVPRSLFAVLVIALAACLAFPVAAGADAQPPWEGGTAPGSVDAAAFRLRDFADSTAKGLWLGMPGLGDLQRVEGEYVWRGPGYVYPGYPTMPPATQFRFSYNSVTGMAGLRVGSSPNTITCNVGSAGAPNCLELRVRAGSNGWAEPQGIVINGIPRPDAVHPGDILPGYGLLRDYHIDFGERSVFELSGVLVFKGYSWPLADLSLVEFTVGRVPLPNVAPLASIGGPYTVPEGSTTMLTGLATDADGDALTYQWDLNHDGVFELTGTSVPFNATGIDGVSGGGTAVPVQLRVTDEHGASVDVPGAIAVTNVAPVVGAMSMLSPLIQLGDMANARAEFFDPADVGSHGSTWQWGDGSTSAGSVAGLVATGDHLYGSAGLYGIGVTIDDGDGGIGSSFLADAVTVNAAPVPAISGTLDAPEGGTTTLIGDATDPFGGVIADTDFAWDFDLDGTTDAIGRAVAFDASAIDGPATHTVRLTVTDSLGGVGTTTAVVSIYNVAPTAAIASAPSALYQLGDSVSIGVEVGDVSAADAAGLRAFIDWGDGTSEQEVPVVSGAFTGTHLYSAAGSYVVRTKIVDDDGGVTAGPTADVEINTPPQIGLAAASVTQGGSLSLDAMASDADGDPLTYEWCLDGDGCWDDALANPALFSAATFDGPGSVIVHVRVSDDHGGIVMGEAPMTILSAPPVVGPVSVSAAVVPVGTSVTARASVSDPYADEVMTARFLWGDGSTGAALPCTTLASGSHAYTTPGVYTVTVEVADDDGECVRTSYEFVVVYDPSGGFATGGGWIMSPEGAYAADTALSGKASFGFVSKYLKGATVPSGSTQFQFHVAGFNFHSNAQQWLVVNGGGTNAQFKGSGSVNGVSGYDFMIWATDGGKTAADTFRIKIWPAGDETHPVYDNGVQQAIAGGSIVVHR